MESYGTEKYSPGLSESAFPLRPRKPISFRCEDVMDAAPMAGFRVLYEKRDRYRSLDIEYISALFGIVKPRIASKVIDIDVVKFIYEGMPDSCT